MIRPEALTAATLALALASTAPARAAMLDWDFSISEHQIRNGPEPDGTTNSPATGHAHITYDTATNVIAYTISWSNLFGALTKLHIHGPADENTSTARHILEIFGPPDIPASLDLHTDTWTDSHTLETLSQPGFEDITPVQIIGIMSSGLAYVNVHTTVFGAGEIRGNLGLPVPTPVTAFLFTLPALTTLRRKRP